MIAHVRNHDVEVDLDGPDFTLRWADAGTVLGPCRATALVDGAEHVIGARGTWELVPGDGYGRAGTWARCASGDGAVTLHVPDDGPVVVIDVVVAMAADARIDRLTPLVGATDLEYERRLVDGYDSWAYSGIRGPEPGASFWNTVYVGSDDRCLALQALDARLMCTRIANDRDTVRVDCAGAPLLTKAAGTWGYLVGEQPSLRLPVESGSSLRSEPVAVGAARAPVALVEDLASLAAHHMGARRWDGPPPNGWESWYHHGLFVSADDVLTNARVLRQRYADRPDLDLVQIDDGWQRTYGAWWPNERFPDDLGELVHTLGSLGCRAGLWLAPFRVQPEAPGLATDHPDWCLRGPGGAPLLEPRSGSWALDASHPDAVEWLQELGAQVRAWGFEMVKVDFCYLAALDGDRYDDGVTGTEALVRGFRALVDGLGEGIYVLGCGMPMLPAVGLCHGNRVGHDLAMPRVHQELGHPLDRGWTGFAGVRAQARNVAARWAQAGRWYDADPEVVMAWGSDGTDPAGYSVEEARTIATMVAIAGGPFLLADELASLGATERAVVEHPALLDIVGRSPFRPIDALTTIDPDDVPEHAFSQGPGIPRIWQAERDGTTVRAAFNWSEEPVDVAVPVELVGVTELWTGAPTGSQLRVPPHAVRVLRARG